MQRKIWFNGEILPETEAKLSVYDSALMFGDMVFEMTRSFNQKQFRLRAHLERLSRSMKHMQIDCPYTLAEIETACRRVQKHNMFDLHDEHRLMINVSRGILSSYEEVEGVASGINVMITDFPVRWITAGMGELFETGISCTIPTQQQIPSRLLETKVKHRSRAHFIQALMEGAWPLLLDETGAITEGPGYNFFVIIGGVCYTPQPRNILMGISREYICQLTSVTVTDMTPFDVITAGEEAFITATPFCMLPITAIQGIPIGNGKVGPNFKRLLSTWSAAVDVDIARQIQDWDKKYSATYGPPYICRK